LAERSLRHFIRQAWDVIEPGTTFLDNWHIDCVAEHLEAVTAGQITRLLINEPPRHMKSIEVSICWPAWEWVRLPAERWMFASYSQALSTEHSLKRRDIIESDWYQRNWADRFRLVTDQNVKTEFKNDKQGVMFATSTTGSATGKGGNRLVVDDPHDPTQAESDQVRDNQVRTFRTKLSTRLNDKKRGAIVVVMQRLNQKDLSGYLKERGGYTHLCLPAESEGRTTITFPMTGRVIEREDGDLLWPAREGPKEIAEAKLTLGSYGHAGQYQQRPSPAGGGLFKSKWFRRWKYDESLEYYLLLRPDGSWRPVRIDACQRFAVVDVAGTEKRTGVDANDPDFSVLEVWDMTPDGDMILVHVWRDQTETPEVEDAVVRECHRWDAPYVLVESNGIGLGVVQSVRRRGIAVRALNAKKHGGDKVARSQTAQIRAEAGTVYIPQAATWLQDFEAEVEAFPTGAHDDQVDPFAYAAIHVQRLGGAIGDRSDDEAEQRQRDKSAADHQEELDQQLRENYDPEEVWGRD
jgi:predicted phage terminase large subunit-like protein